MFNRDEVTDNSMKNLTLSPVLSPSFSCLKIPQADIDIPKKISPLPL